MKPASSGRRQVPLRHTRSPEQSVGVVPPGGGQHGLSISPHALAGSAFTHVPVVTSHASDPTHEVAPSQHAWPSSPHAAHVPSVHTRPERHVKPGQQVRPVIPQSSDPGGRSSSGLTHAPSTHARPMQQSLEPAHAAVRGAQHAPPWQARPRQQSLEESQRAPPPGWMQQVSPLPQRRPSSQMRPTQHAPPAAPQLPVGPTLPSGRVEPSIPPPSRGVEGLLAQPGAANDAASRAHPTKPRASRMAAMLAAHLRPRRGGVAGLEARSYLRAA